MCGVAASKGRSETVITALHCCLVPASLTRVTAETAGEDTMTAGVAGRRIWSRNDQQSCKVCGCVAVAVSQRITQPSA